ncbi:MFS transporter [Paenibacillus xylaniclasticus]|uniref:MFS transporter n=1 Tax=Paenibacillus xylaniclasticus TaxID=588083 RepID=UPI0013DED4B6|nr:MULTISPECIES: MFS transporter [Paenibacillus]GFN32244.1 hypothetical protein PCURB6_25040 [Paenibacillus curdlanolyticus]
MNWNRRFLVLSLLLGSLLSALEFTVIASIAPLLVAELDKADWFAWASSGYMISSTVFTLIAGKLCDRIGRKPTFIAGTAIFAAGSIACGLAPNMLVFIMGRLVQGLGGGLMVPASSTIVGDLYEGQRRVKIQGGFAATWGICAIAGPVVGRFVAVQWDWRWLFLGLIPISILIIAMISLTMRETIISESRTPLDYRGMVLLSGSICSLLLLFETSGMLQLSFFLTAVILTGLLIRSLRAATDPIIEPRLLRRADINVMYVVATVMGANTFVAITFFPFTEAWALGKQAADSGQLLIPLTLGAVAATISCGTLVRLLSVKTLQLIGLSFMLLGDLIVCILSDSSSERLVSVSAVCIGVGTGLLMPLLSSYIQQGANWSDKGMLTAYLSFFRSVGGSLGVIAAAFLFKQSLPASFDWVSLNSPDIHHEAIAADLNLPISFKQTVMSGMHTVFGLCAALSAAGIAAVAIIPLQSVIHHNKESDWSDGERM